MANPEEMSAMFPIFVLSLLVLFLLPWTWYRITSRVRHEEKARCGCSLCRSQPKNARTLMGWVKGFLTIGNTITILLWLVALGLVFLIKASGTQAAVFDPYEVLGVSPSASEQEIKQAYRRKSLKYHPDKNPDPEAATYFAEKITKAYKALTDPVMRENYEKYGHPDGQQHMAVGIALPTFMLDKNTASGPLLLALVGLGIIAPLLVCVVYLSSSSKYMGNRVMRSTMAFFQDWMRRKEGLAPSKVMEVILKAEEFYHLGVLRAQQEGLNVLFKEVKGELGLDPKNIKKETEKFWNQYPWMVKANLLVVAQMMRADEQVAPTLKKDFAATLALVPRLLDALMLVSLHPDPYHSPYGYMRASVSVLQFSQCFIQGVPISARKVDKGGSKEDSDAKASLLQLPFLQVDDLKKLARKRVNCLQDLLERPREEQVEILRSLGRMTDQAIDDVIETLAIVPTVDVEGSCQTDQEEAILEGDTVTLRCWVRVSRPKGGMHAFVHSPYYPLPKEEGWWVIFGDSSSNAVYVGQKVLLQDEATALESVRKAMENNPMMKPDEAASYLLESARTPADVLAKVKAGYRLQEAKFLAPASLGESRPFMLTLHVISDCWIGVEKKITIKLKVGKRSRKGTRGMGGAEGDDVHSDGEGEEEEHDEEADEEEEDYEDEEYSDEEEEEGEGDEEEEDDAGKGKGKGKYSLTQGPAKKKAEGTSSSQQNGSTREANHNDADGQGSDGDADKDDDEATSHVSGQDAENDDDDAESS